MPLLAIVAVLAAAYGAAVEDGAASVADHRPGRRGGRRRSMLAGRWLVEPDLPPAGPLRRARGHDWPRPCWSCCGAAWAMSLGGLSMAMGAFLAGVLLSESTFRHQLEADVEPFRAHPAGPVLPQRRHVAGPGVVVRRLALGGRRAWSPSWWSRRSAIYGVARLFKASARRGAASARPCSRRAASSPSSCTARPLAAGLFDARTGGHPDGHRHPVDGADAADGHAVPTRLLPDRDAVGRRRRRRRPRQGPARAGADHRLRPLRPGRVPAAAGPRRRRLDHRHRRRDDPGRRQVRLQGLLRRRLAAGRAARLGRREGRDHPGLRRQARGRRPDRRTGQGRVPADQAVRPRLRPRPLDPPDQGRGRVPASARPSRAPWCSASRC